MTVSVTLGPPMDQCDRLPRPRTAHRFVAKQTIHTKLQQLAVIIAMMTANILVIGGGEEPNARHGLLQAMLLI